VKDIKTLFDLTGRTALITGAGGSLGSQIAMGLARYGVRVVLWGRSLDTLEELAAQIIRLGGEALVQQVDLFNDEQLSKTLDRFKEQNAEVDILINSAYSGDGGSCESASNDDFSKAYQIAVVSAFRIIQSLRPLLRSATISRVGGSSVINIASMYGVVSPDLRVYDRTENANPPFYGAAKAGLIQLTRYMACEFASENIRVNSISPGPFPNKKVRTDNPLFCKQLAGRVPLGRLGNPMEMIGPVLFLASDASSYVTGTNLIVDGGWTAW